MKVAIRFALLAFISVPLSANTNDSWGAWQKVSPGLYKRVLLKGHVRSVVYRAIGEVGRENLAQIHPSKVLIQGRTHSQTLRIGSGSCNDHFTGGATISSYTGEDVINCSDGSAITATLSIDSVPGSIPGGNYTFNGTGSVDAYVHKACTPVGGTITCPKQKPQEPDDWRIQATWSSTDGNSGYHCVEGDSFPYACQ